MIQMDLKMESGARKDGMVLEVTGGWSKQYATMVWCIVNFPPIFHFQIYRLARSTFCWAWVQRVGETLKFLLSGLTNSSGFHFSIFFSFQISSRPVCRRILLKDWPQINWAFTNSFVFLFSQQVLIIQLLVAQEFQHHRVGRHLPLVNHHHFLRSWQLQLQEEVRDKQILLLFLWT